MTVPTNTHTNTETGLSDTEARSRLLKFGANEPVSRRRLSSLIQILPLFVNPLAIILLVASAISAALGDTLQANECGAQP